MTHPKPQIVAATVLTTTVLVGIALWTQANLGASLLPHAFCITGTPSLLWLHLVSDGLIAVAYLLIPWAMLNFIRQRQDLPFGWIAWVFGAFILACGMTHALEMWTLWEPVYWYSGVLKAFTAAVSLATAWLIYMLTPQALAIPSGAQLRSANEALEREIASRRQAESDLQAAKAELEVLLRERTAQAEQASALLDRFFDAAPLGLFVLDGDLRFVRTNRALVRHSGRDGSEFVDATLPGLSGVPAAAVETLREVARTGQARHDVELSRPEPDGHVRHWLFTCFPIAAGAGRTLLGGILEDVTQHRRAERERQEALEAAQAASEAKDQFLAKVSHELRSPLQVAMSSSEVLRRLPGLPEDARRFAERVAHAVRLQATMINDLLDLSRILSGKLNIEADIVDPAQPLVQALDHWTLEARKRGIAFDAAGVVEGQAVVQADPVRLEQVYSNLLDNAMRFSEAGGRVEVRSAVEGATWQLQVRDEGAGLTPQDLARIFEPFTQGANQPRVGKGLGLGLAIVRSLVEAFGGRVSARSDGAGRGSTFTVELPVAPSAQARTPAPAPRTMAASLQDLRILYVEDEPGVAAAMADGLRQLGAQVHVAHDYYEALRRLRELPLDVLITDLNLGEGPSGHDVAQALWRDPRHTSVPAIAVSAFGSRDDLAATQRLGFAHHLVKPVDADTVALAIQQALRR